MKLDAYRKASSFGSNEDDISKVINSQPILNRYERISLNEKQNKIVRPHLLAEMAESKSESLYPAQRQREVSSV